MKFEFYNISAMEYFILTSVRRNRFTVWSLECGVWSYVGADIIRQHIPIKICLLDKLN